MKTNIILSLILAVIILTGFYSGKKAKPEQPSMNMPAPPQQKFEYYPPYAKRFWVQQLKTPLTTGENLIFSVQYESDSILPDLIEVYDDKGKVALVLRDDGRAPDTRPADKKYAAYKKEKIAEMKTRILDAEKVLETKKQYPTFIGHTGTFKFFKDIVKFNKTDFDQFKEVEVSVDLINAEDCDLELLKEKSLFITDLSVVEDEQRTYNVAAAAGTPNGAWTFGTLMDNIENNTHSDGLRGFLKDWVKYWLADQTVNGQIVLDRGVTDGSGVTTNEAFEHMIKPWLVKANSDIPFYEVDFTDWEMKWNATSEEALKINAPFKLTAIVNRIDLRGNGAYGGSMSNTGETRFIYTLIDPVTGDIPIHINQPLSEQVNGVGFVDWRGMNVIFEYGNPHANRCDLRDFAQEWLDLSDANLYFGTASSNNPYKIALQSITDQITVANVAPSKINGSAINRIRTNERLFAPLILGITNESSWEKADWEFRQFELSSSTQSLVMVPLTNNPPHTANYAPNIEEDYSTANPTITNNDVINWIFDGHKHQVLNGNFNLPTALLSGSGMVRRKEAQFFGLEPTAFATAGNYNEFNDSQEAKDIRQQLSVNTCAGCHNGETKTVFTHVNALKYTEQARYWLPGLDGASAIPQDPTFYPNGSVSGTIGSVVSSGGGNDGNTADDYLMTSVANFSVEDEIEPRTFFQAVSPFLTGRRYRPANVGAEWQDDESDDGNISGPDVNFEFPDIGMLGYFYVNDPDNSDNFPYMRKQKRGFNDLLMRHDRMCQFLNQSCEDGGTLPVVKLMEMILFIPLPKGGH